MTTSGKPGFTRRGRLKYYVLAIVLAPVVLYGSWVIASHKAYYIPSEAMMPTLMKWDRIIVDMADRTPRRGEVIIFRAPGGADYIKRVAALGGDTVEMRDGVPVINGMAADQRPAGTMKLESPFGPAVARRLSERLPGENGRHFILDDGTTEVDTMAAATVPVGSIFMLGDNRDHSADSRVPIEDEGVGFVPLLAVRGRVLFIHYSPDHSRIGTRINP
jgi:signal peptidase I